MLWMSFGFDPGAPKGSPPAPAGVSWGGVAATVAHVQRCDASTGIREPPSGANCLRAALGESVEPGEMPAMGKCLTLERIDGKPAGELCDSDTRGEADWVLTLSNRACFRVG